MTRSIGILFAAGCLVAGLALAQYEEPGMEVPDPQAPPVPETPEPPPAPAHVPRPVSETPAPAPPAGPESPDLPDNPVPPAAIVGPAVAALPGEWVKTGVTGVPV